MTGTIFAAISTAHDETAVLIAVPGFSEVIKSGRTILELKPGAKQEPLKR